MAARYARIISGFGLVIGGVFLLVLPGPGILTIIAGLVLLSSEFHWARRLLAWVKARFGQYAERDSQTDKA